MLQVQAQNHVYGAVTDCIIDFLEQGIVPWYTSWVDSGIPSNLLTKRPYRAINILMLAAKEYRRNYFLTERQIDRLGAYIYKGQKPHVIVDGIGFRSHQQYEVYNIEQCGDIPRIIVPKYPEKRPPIEVFKEIIERMEHCPRLVHGDTIPFYDLSEDIITMPSMRYFASCEEYYDLFFKQLVAATKHWTRLDRHDDSFLEQFFPEIMAIEELIIEIGSWYIRSYVGMDVKQLFDNQYISRWIEMFEKNPILVFEAAEMAQKAAEFILREQFDEKEAIDYVEDEMLPF